MDEDLYNAYEKVANFFNRSVADFMREALQGGLPTIHTLGAMIDRAKAGDKEAVQELYDSLIDMHEGTIQNARVTHAAEKATDAEANLESAGASNTAL
jgi:hypothetical protein